MTTAVAPTEVTLRSVHMGPRLRELRERAGYKQSDLARKLGLDPAQPSRWECPWSTRYQAVPGKHLPRLADILEVSLEELAPEALNRKPVPLPPLVVRMSAPQVPAQATMLLNLFHMPPPDAPEDEGSLRSREHRNVIFTTGGDPSPLPRRTVARIRCWSCGTINSGPPNDPPNDCSDCGARIRALTTIRLIYDQSNLS